MDQDGHRMVIYDDSHGRPVCAPPSKPSTGSTKTNTGTKKSSGGSSSYDDDDYSPPPPPNPVEKYIKQFFLNVVTITAPIVTTVVSAFTTKSTVKNVALASVGTKSSVLNTVTKNTNKSSTEIVSNNYSNILSDPFGGTYIGSNSSLGKSKVATLSVEQQLKFTKEFTSILDEACTGNLASLAPDE